MIRRWVCWRFVSRRSARDEWAKDGKRCREKWESRRGERELEIYQKTLCVCDGAMQAPLLKGGRSLCELPLIHPSSFQFINYLVKTEYLEGVLTQFNKLGASVWDISFFFCQKYIFLSNFWSAGATRIGKHNNLSLLSSSHPLSIFDDRKTKETKKNMVIIQSHPLLIYYCRCRGEKCAGMNCAPSQCSCREVSTPAPFVPDSCHFIDFSQAEVLCNELR